MPDGRGARLALEAGFLVAVAAVLVLAHLHAGWIVLAMLVAWLIVALLEWVSWRDEPHWASGQPPRYHVPEQPLPPRPPSVELPRFSGYPEPAAREPEAPTWIAPPELREQMLAWPPPSEEPLSEEPPVPPEEPQTTVEELPEELLAEAAAAAEEEREPVGWPVAARREGPWPAEPEPQPASDTVSRAEESAPAVEPGPEPVVAAAAAPLARPVRHRLDPYADANGRRRRQRGRADDAGAVELTAVPAHVRIASAAPAREDA